MPDSICLVESCGRLAVCKRMCRSHYAKALASDPGRPRCHAKECTRVATVKGLCRRHYAQAREDSPETSRCSVEGCVVVVRSRGLCRSHYHQVYAADQTRPQCCVEGCELAVVNKSRCGRHYRQARDSDQSVPRCAEPECHKAAMVRSYCQRHYHQRTPQGRAAKAHGKAARRVAVAAGETFDPHEIFHRDGWICQSCGCDCDTKYPHPRSPELDHVIPLSKGGEHTRANTQLLCKSCNGMKNARVPLALTAVETQV